MRVIFFVDATPNIEMFVTIIKKLPVNYDNLVINLDRWTKQTEIELKLEEHGIKYKTIGGWSQSHIDRMLEEVKPDIIAMPHDSAIPLDGLIISRANTKHIPTLYIPHGILTPQGRKSPLAKKKRLYWRGIISWIKLSHELIMGSLTLMRLDKPAWKFLLETGRLWIKYLFRYRPEGHGGCSKMAVYGDITKELLISEGINSKHIVVTGNPKFDYLFSAKGSDCKSKVCQRYGIPEDEDIILLLTDYFVEVGEWTPGQRKQFIMAVCKAASKLLKCKLIIKLHPSAEKEEDYQEIIKDLPQKPIICRNVPLWELLHACSLAITVSSMAGLEAMAADKPLVIFNLFKNVTAFDESSGAFIVYTESNLLSVLQEILNKGLSTKMKKAAEHFVYRQAYLQDGKASKRIADLIMQMGKESNSRSFV